MLPTSQPHTSRMWCAACTHGAVHTPHSSAESRCWLLLLLIAATSTSTSTAMFSSTLRRRLCTKSLLSPFKKSPQPCTFIFLCFVHSTFEMKILFTKHEQYPLFLDSKDASFTDLQKSMRWCPLKTPLSGKSSYPTTCNLHPRYYYFHYFFAPPALLLLATPLTQTNT